MAIYTTNYSALITKGLGGPACCGIITAQFGINCGCSISVIPVPEGKGGGGPVAGFYVPLPKKLQQRTKMVLVTVKFSPTWTWRRSYVVHTNKADMIVKVINFANNMKDKVAVGVEKIKTAKRTVAARFHKE